MLRELHIQNFAIIDHLELTFERGLVIFTGETGAGKSIILDALELLLGGRADVTHIRAEADLARVEATFHLIGSEREVVHAVLRREDLLDDQDYLTLSREVRREGRSVARVNGAVVNLSLLKELGETLVDIHGQSEHLSLLNVRAHLGLLDRYADVQSLLGTYRQTYQQWQTVRRELDALRQTQQEADRRVEMLTFQAEEIEAARLRPGEDEELRRERDRLANAESLAALAQQALAALDEGAPDAPAATDLLGQAAQALNRLAQIDPEQAARAQQAALLEESLADLARALRNYLETIEYDPRRLNEVEERLDLLHRLTRKYGGSIEAVLAHAAEARRQLEHISNATERITRLEAEEQALLTRLSEQAQALSQERRRAAEQLSRAIEAELDDLRMAAARFTVDFQTHPDPNGLLLPDGTRVAFDENGLDRVEFLIAPNPGEGLKPLAKIASGGETSRLMLGLKNVLARADEVPTLIFDEIDQGIGGRVGATVGEKLWLLGRQHQVLVVTHLPQLAAFGDQHFQVQKQLADGRTLTRVTQLTGQARLLELAQMLGEVSEGTLRSAYDLLQNAQTFKASRH